MLLPGVEVPHLREVDLRRALHEQVIGAGVDFDQGCDAGPLADGGLQHGRDYVQGGDHARVMNLSEIAGPFGSFIVTSNVC